uniref:HSF-type DNA-binding domain-containing protein n=1 Tax=Aegilops tauschii TaxID=37682 RepID=M8B8C7_AEGTA
MAEPKIYISCSSPDPAAARAGGALRAAAALVVLRPPFLSKTYDLVSEPWLDGVISWGPAGKSFVVWNPSTFALDVLLHNFKHNFSSFVRQLNTYVRIPLTTTRGGRPWMEIARARSAAAVGCSKEHQRICVDWFALADPGRPARNVLQTGKSPLLEGANQANKKGSPANKVA